MPVSTITVRGKWTHKEKAALMEALHASLVEHFQTPEDDRLIRVHELRDEDFMIPPGKDRFVLVEIAVFAGRSPQAKRHLYAGIVSRFAELGIAAEDNRILLHEVPMENWGIRGGQMASDLELGYTVKV